MALPEDFRLTWAQLKHTHPDYLIDYWNECRALTAGGRRLLGNIDLLKKLLPKHAEEEQYVYDERLSRAFFIPYPGEIVGDLVAGLAQDPVRVTAEPKPEEFYTDCFLQDVDRQGMTVTAFVQNRMREALQVRVAWSLVDLPKRGDVPLDSLAAEEAAGVLRAYVVPLEAESVTDWEEDEEGSLLWVLVRRKLTVRSGPGAAPEVLERFTFYTREEWVRFEVRHAPDKEPADKDDFAPVLAGAHSFGAVPVVRLELPEGLWALDKLHSIARAHFNQRNAFSWSQFKHLFPLLTAFLGPEQGSGGEVPSDAQTNPERATQQVYGTGRVHVFGAKDDVRYVSPDGGVFTVAAADLNTLRDEMHRVTSMMASTIDNTAAAVGRSGESKQQDKSSRDVVLAALGVICLDHVHDVLRLVASGRKDPLHKWSVNGLSEFDSVSAASAVESAQLVDGLTIPSPTFWRTYRGILAGRILRRDVDPATLDKIKKEIEANTPDEDYAPLPPRQPPPGLNGGKVDPALEDGGEDPEEGDQQGNGTPPRRTPA